MDEENERRPTICRLIRTGSATAAAFLLVVALAMAADDWRFWTRYFSQWVADYGFGPALEKFEPRERVPGAPAVPLPRATAEGRAFSDEVLTAAAQYAARNNSSSLIIWQGGKIHLESYWGGDANTVIDSKSLHKMLVGLLTGRAIAQNYIASLDTPVAEHLPEWRSDARATITVRHLLHMASGLEWSRGDLHPWAMSQRNFNTGDLEAMLLGLQLVSEPGRYYDYSNATSDLLGLVITRATGKRYAQYLSEELWSRVGAAEAELYLDRPGGLPHSGCCLAARPLDWLRVGLLALNNGKVGSEQLLPEWWMREALKPSGDNPRFGMHLWLGRPYAPLKLALRHEPPPGSPPFGLPPGVGTRQSQPFAADDLFLFDGADDQKMYIIPSRDMIILRTGRAPRDWDDAYLPNLLIRSLDHSSGVGRHVSELAFESVPLRDR